VSRAGPRRGWPVYGKKAGQKGQALLYGIFVLLAGLATLFFFFNTGQLTREKTKLVNTTDAVAYSAGVMHARTLNFHAYTNRAMVANTIAIAQLTSLSSWVQYTDSLATWGWQAFSVGYKYPLYMPSYWFDEYWGPYSKQYLVDSGVLEDLSQTSDGIITSLALAQRVAHLGLLPARFDVMRDVAEANYRGDGTIQVDAVPISGNEYMNFVRRYEDDERTRFREVVLTSLRGDRFVQRRSWSMPGLYANCTSAFPRVDWVDRRGGTELIGFDEWKAVDTMSEKRWVPKNKTDVLCQGISEQALGWGAQNAADDPSFDPDPLHYDQAPIVTPSPYAMAVATSASWDYNGMPAFYELSDSARDNPNLQFVIRLRRDSGQTRTSGSRSLIGQTPQLNAYTPDAARDAATGRNVYAAVSGSEAFFERPPGARENVYGRGRGEPLELGSLFNPYWQVRLIAPTRTQLAAARALQSVVLAE